MNLINEGHHFGLHVRAAAHGTARAPGTALPRVSRNKQNARVAPTQHAPTQQHGTGSLQTPRLESSRPRYGPVRPPQKLQSQPAEIGVRAQPGALLQNVWLLAVAARPGQPFIGRRFINTTPERLRQLARNQGAFGVLPLERFFEADAASTGGNASLQEAQTNLEGLRFRSGGQYVLQFLHTSFAEQVQALPKGWQEHASHLEATQMSQHALRCLQEAGHSDAEIPEAPSAPRDRWFRQCGVAVAPGCAAVVDSATEATPESVRQLRLNMDRLRKLAEAGAPSVQMLQGRRLLGVLAVYAVTADAAALARLQRQAHRDRIEILFLNGHPPVATGVPPFFSHPHTHTRSVASEAAHLEEDPRARQRPGRDWRVCLEHRTPQPEAPFATGVCLFSPSLDSFRECVAQHGAVGVVPKEAYDSQGAGLAEQVVDDRLPCEQGGTYVLQYLTGSLLNEAWDDSGTEPLNFKLEHPRNAARRYLETMGYVITPRWFRDTAIDVRTESATVQVPAVALSYWDTFKFPWKPGVAAIVDSVPVATLQTLAEFVEKLARLRCLVDEATDGQVEELHGRELLPVLVAHTLTADVCNQNKLVDTARLCSISIWSPNGCVLHRNSEDAM